MWDVYVLQCADDSLYVGLSRDVQRRLNEHAVGRGRWTRSRLPVKLVYQEVHPSRAEARNREKYLKSGWGKQWLKRKLTRVDELAQ